MLYLLLSFLIACGNSPSKTSENVETATAAATSSVKEIKQTKQLDATAKTLHTQASNEVATQQNDEADKKEERVIKKSVEQPKPAKIEAAKKTITVNPEPVKSAIIEKKDEIKSAVVDAKPEAKVIKAETVNIQKPAVKEIVNEKPAAKVEEVKEKVAVAAFSHDSFNAILKKYVSSTGKVNYKGLKANSADLDSYLESLAANAPSGWSKNKELAYWMNAYNAFTLKLIITNYPIASITNLEGGKPWDKKWIKLAGKTLSLNDIENVIIRPTFKDARIHFAVNCAAKSCPPLLNKAYTASNVQSLLESQTKKFVNNAALTTITPDAVTISKIFDWYGEDFGDLITYLNKYSSTKINAGAKVNFMEYDWSLNE